MLFPKKILFQNNVYMQWQAECDKRTWVSFIWGLKCCMLHAAFLDLRWYLKAGLLPFCPVEAGTVSGFVFVCLD